MSKIHNFNKFFLNTGIHSHTNSFPGTQDKNGAQAWSCCLKISHCKRYPHSLLLPFTTPLPDHIHPQSVDPMPLLPFEVLTNPMPCSFTATASSLIVWRQFHTNGCRSCQIAPSNGESLCRCQLWATLWKGPAHPSSGKHQKVLPSLPTECKRKGGRKVCCSIYVGNAWSLSLSRPAPRLVEHERCVTGHPQRGTQVLRQPRY